MSSDLVLALSTAEMQRITGELNFVWRIVESIQGTIRQGARVLDVGCGYGGTVWLLAQRGYDSAGIDIEADWRDPRKFGDGRPPAPAWLQERLHVIARDDYRLPFADHSFDVAISSQVFEHVEDYVAVFRELGRVLTPAGVSVNIVPARWRPLEPHTHVPLGTVWRTRVALGLWAMLGIRNSFQKGQGWRTVRELNHAYLNHSTFYPSRASILRWAHAAGVRVEFRPDVYVKHHVGLIGLIGRAIPSAASLLGEVSQRAMILRPQ